MRLYELIYIYNILFNVNLYNFQKLNICYHLIKFLVFVNQKLNFNILEINDI